MTESLNQKPAKPNRLKYLHCASANNSNKKHRTSSRSRAGWEEWEGVEVGGGNVSVNVIEAHYTQVWKSHN